MCLMKQATEFGVVDARPIPLRSLQQCARYAPKAARIGLETGPLTTWLWTALMAEGLPVVCLDARHAKKALDMRVNKTDANDSACRLVSGGPGQRSQRHARKGVAWRTQSVAEHVTGA